MKMLEVDNLCLAFRETVVLDGISFSVKDAETVGLIGPNGSGKTTLFNCISGFNRPDRGSIALKGQDITKEPPFRRAAMGLGRMFQNFGVFKEMTVLENVITAIEARRGSILLPWSKRAREIQDEAMEYLRQIGLEPKSKEKAGSLSGGQMRLLEITRTVAFGAELLLLDEPTAGVSPKMKDEMIKLLLRLQKMKKTLLVIEHDIEFIQRFCSRIVVLDVGKVVLDGTPDDVRAHPLLQEIYFGNSSEVGSSF